MANIFLNKRFSNYTKLACRIRRLSSFNVSKIGSFDRDELNIWSENNWSNIGKQFNKTIDFPLPGQTGLLFKENNKKLDKSTVDKSSLLKFDLFYRPQTFEKQFDTFIQAISHKKEMETEFISEETDAQTEMKNCFELKPYKCPLSLVKDFQSYFPTTHTALTVITVCLKTENDMATYSSDVEMERELLMKKYVDLAQDVCIKIRNQGYWVDFIDPASGRPFNGPFTNLTFFETDERYRQLGFEIIDYGCCKVISHHKWGTKSYVGSILTTAPHESKFIQQLIENFKQ